MKLLKKLAALVTAGVMALAALPLTASAEEDWMEAAKTAENGKQVSFTLPDDKNDVVYYKVNLKQSGYLVVDFSSTADSTWFNIYDSNSKRISPYWTVTSGNGGAEGEGNWTYFEWDSTAKKAEGKISAELVKGTYYLEFQRRGDLGTGKVNFTPHFYDTSSTLCNAKKASSGKKYTSELYVTGEEAVYKFNVAKSGTMKINLGQSYVNTSKLTAMLYKESDDEVVEIDSVDTESEYFENRGSYVFIDRFSASGTISYKVTKGTYYLRIAQTTIADYIPEITMTATFPESSSNEGKISYLGMTIKKGTSIQLSAIMADDGKVTWSSSSKNVVTVSSTGKITAKKAGSAIITAKTGKNTVKIKIIVK